MMKIYVMNILLIIILNGCFKKIEEKNKIAILAKISIKAVGERNGAKSIAYYYNKKKYGNTTSFDARYFDYGDYFLIYIDKTNPNNDHIPKPKIKLNDTNELKKNAPNNYYINEDDVKLLEEAE